MGDSGLFLAGYGDLLTRATIWFSVAFWAVGIGVSCRQPVWGRRFLTLGFHFYVVHVFFAFEVFYGWSHATAYGETARQTAEMTGWNSGAGLWLNYLFGLVWLADLLYWWLVGYDRYRKRPGWISGVVHGFMAFMILNGTVIFGQGAVRWFGVAVFGGLALTFLLRRPAKTIP